MLISYFTSMYSILPAVIMGMMGCPCVIHKLYVLCMEGAVCVSYFLTGAKEVDLFLSRKTQVFKVTDGLAIVSCLRLLISSEAEKKCIMDFIRCALKSLRRVRLFDQKHKAKYHFFFFGLHV